MKQQNTCIYTLLEHHLPLAVYNNTGKYTMTINNRNINLTTSTPLHGSTRDVIFTSINTHRATKFVEIISLKIGPRLTYETDRDTC